MSDVQRLGPAVVLGETTLLSSHAPQSLAFAAELCTPTPFSVATAPASALARAPTLRPSSPPLIALDYIRRFAIPWLSLWARTEPALRERLIRYPRNHAYLVHDGNLVPSFRLYSRWKQIASLYPDPLRSILDVGSCRGYFVLDAAKRPSCRAAAGIDVHEPFVSLSREVADRTLTPNARFYVADLEAFARNHESYGGPFQTVLLLNVYHYLFYGSDMSAFSLGGHRAILKRLWQVCTDRVIFSSPLALAECPGQIQRRAAERGTGAEYSPEKFLAAAAEFFIVEDEGRWGKRPLLRLMRRARPAR